VTPEAEANISSESSSGASEGRNAVAIVASLWEKLESLVQLELKLALAEADEKVSVLKREVFAEAETKVSALKVDVFAEAETKVAALKVEVFAEADARISALKSELFAKAIGGSIGVASILTFVGALIAALALVMDVWIAALLVSSVLAVASFLLLRRSPTFSPQPTNESQTRASLTPTSSTKETSHGTI